MVVWCFIGSLGRAEAQTPKPGAVIRDELRKGGLVIYLRHAHADQGEDQISDPTYWKDCAKQRMLSPEGRATAHKIGLMVKGLQIPVGKVYSGELCRAKQTAELLELGPVETTSELNDYNTWKAQGNDPQKLVAAYQHRLGAMPPAGTNTVLVSHTQRAGFCAHPALDLIEMGSVAIFRPKADGSFELLATLRSSDWELLGFAELPSSSHATAPAPGGPAPYSMKFMGPEAKK